MNVEHVSELATGDIKHEVIEGLLPVLVNQATCKIG